MSKCDCGRTDIPLGMTGMTAGGITHGVTACVSGWAEQDRADLVEARADALEAEVVDLSEEVTLLKAQVQRVRKVKRRTKNIYKDGFDVGWNACLAAVLRALDGPCPTCSGPISRETVGLTSSTT